MIKINNLNKYYNKGKNNEIHVINDVNVELPDTGFVSILGESGSGKTTLLNVIGGLDRATGNITYDDNTFNGYQMNKIDDYRIKNIGYVFQNYNLINDYSVLKNLEVVLEAIGVTDKEEVKKRCEYVLKKVGLYRFRKKLARELSGGQLQRVSIARALVKKSKIIIADEPTGNLDSNNSIEVMNILKKISEKSLVILVTHNKNLAYVYSDTILDIVDGKIINVRENDGSSILKNTDSNKVYLKDMESVSVGDKIKTTIYSTEEIPNVNLELVYKNGTYYIKSNIKLELIENTNFEFVDEHYEEKDITKISEELDYDDSWFTNKEEKKNPFKKFFSNLKAAFISFKSARPRAKFLRIVLTIIGVVLGVVILNLSSKLYVDTSTTLTNDKLYTLKSSDNLSPYEINEDIIKAKEDGAIGNIYGMSLSTNSYYAKSMSVENYINSYVNEYDVLEVNRVYGFDLIKDIPLLVGSMPNDNSSSIIDKKVADRILEKFDLSGYEAIINSNKVTIAIDNRVTRISGISSAENNLVYLNYGTYSEDAFGGLPVISHVSHIEDYKVYSSYTFAGRMPEAINEVVLTQGFNYGKESYNLGDKITILGDNFIVVGMIKNIVNEAKIFVGDDFVQANSGNSPYVFEINEKSFDYFKNYPNYKLDTVFNFYKNEQLRANLSRSIALFIGTLVLLGIIIVYIYFTMRSKMIADIKEIGTLRSIGIKKGEILKKYLLEIVLSTLLTSLIGYILVMVIGGIFIKYIMELLRTNINIFTLPYPYLGILLIFVANIFFGLLPIWNLLRKTPSEIMAKYDI